MQRRAAGKSNLFLSRIRQLKRDHGKEEIPPGAESFLGFFRRALSRERPIVDHTQYQCAQKSPEVTKHLGLRLLWEI